MAKLEAMGKDEKTIASQLKNRLKKYSPEVEQAAQARNEGKDSQRRADKAACAGNVRDPGHPGGCES